MGNRLNRIMCFLGLHRGAWQDETVSPCVKQTRTCIHCGVVSQREYHTFDPWERTSIHEETRVCSDCGSTDKRAVFADEWHYPYL
jgi:hypothetical protein